MSCYEDKIRKFEDLERSKVQKDEINKLRTLGASAYIKQLIERKDLYDINDPTRNLFARDLEKIIQFEKDAAGASTPDEVIDKVGAERFRDYAGIMRDALMFATSSRKKNWDTGYKS